MATVDNRTYEEKFKKIYENIKVMEEMIGRATEPMLRIFKHLTSMTQCWPMMMSHPGVQADIDNLLGCSDYALGDLEKAFDDLRNCWNLLEELPHGFEYRNPFYKHGEEAEIESDPQQDIP